MPIVGMTDRIDPSRVLPHIATLYKGDAKPADGRRPGKDLTYFRVEFEPEFAGLRDAWNQLYDTQPTEFAPVRLFGVETDDIFSSWMEEWDATKLLHRCTGADQVLSWDKGVNNYCRARIPCVLAQGCACKPTGRLNVLLPEFRAAVGVFGFFSITTHSTHDILNLHNALKGIEFQAARLGLGLGDIPLVFGRAPQNISVPNTREPGKRMRVDKSLLYIYIEPQFARMMDANQLGSGSAPALPPGEVAPPLTHDAAHYKEKLGAGRDRRLPLGPTPTIGPVDDATGEIFDGEDESAQWTQDEIKRFVAYWRTQAITNGQLLEALRVKGLSDWTGTLEEANATMAAWLDAQLQQA